MDNYQIAKRIANFHKIALSPEHEGDLGSNQAAVCELLMQLLHCKYGLDIMYRSFADRLGEPWRDSLAKHWYEHAEDERKMSYDVAMKLYGMHCDPILGMIDVPKCDSAFDSLCQCLADVELQCIKLSRDILSVCGENVSLRVFIENIIVLDTHHLDDLRRICKSLIA